MRASRVLPFACLTVALAAVAALLLWFQFQDGARGNTPFQEPAEDRSVADIVSPKALDDDVGLIVRVTGAGTSEAVVVLARQANTRVFAEQQETDEYVFSDVPAPGALLVAWATDSEHDRVTAVSELMQLDGTERRLSLHLGRVWPLEIELRRDGGDPDDDADVGLRFPDVDSAATWARNVQLITTKPAAWFLKTRNADGRFTLPLIPAATPIRASGTWGRFAAESQDVELTGPERIVLELGSLPARRFIRVRDGGGAPVEVELATQVSSMPGPEGEVTSRMIHDSTGKDGLLEISATDEDRLIVQVTDENWVPEKYAYRLDAGADMLDIRVRPATTLRMRVQYDDGQPYVGMVYVRAEYPDRDPKAPDAARYLHWSGTLVETEPPPVPSDPVAKNKYGPQTRFHEVIEFGRVPLGLALIVRTEGNKRVAYGHYETTVFALDVPREILIVIPKVHTDRSPSRIRIAGDISEADDCTVSIVRVSENGTVPTDSFLLADSRESGLIRHPGRYLVRLTGASAWQSEEFDLAAGVVHDVYPEPAPPVTVKARILDEAGLPIEGGTLDLESLGGPRFPAKSKAGVIGVSDSDGMVELGGQPQGKSFFRLEAFEREPALVEATLGDEREVFLGEFKLEQARGEIHIRLPEADYTALTVFAHVASPYSFSRRTFPPTTGELMILKGLATGRTYAISLHMKGRAKSLKVFNGAQPTNEQSIIELDATDIDFTE